MKFCCFCKEFLFVVVVVCIENKKFVFLHAGFTSTKSVRAQRRKKKSVKIRVQSAPTKIRQNFR